VEQFKLVSKQNCRGKGKKTCNYTTKNKYENHTALPTLSLHLKYLPFS